MDRSTLIGFLLIAALLFGFSYYNQPSEEELARRESQRQEQAEKQRREDLARREAEKQAKEEAGQDATISDSLRQVEWGEFAGNTGKPETFYTIENNKIRLTVSSRGGQIAKAELKEFTTNAKEPLFLFDKEKDGTCFSVTLLTQNDRVIETKDLDFEPVDYKPGLVDTDSATYTFRVKTSQGATLDYVYTLRQDDYMVGFEIKTEGMGNVLRRNVSDVQVKWTSKIKQQERSKKFEDRYARIYYKPASDDVEKMSPTSDDEEDLTTKVKWIAFKDQFFSSILIADEAMTSAKIRSKMIENDPVYLKKYDADINMPFDLQKEVAAGFHFYFGPNKFQTLKAYDKGVEGDEKLHLEEVIQLGWAIFGWINKYV